MGKQKDMRMIRRGSIITVPRTRRQVARGLVPYTLYDTALSQMAYGQFSHAPGRLGDFFGDIMGAVVGKENWDARPDWLKKVKLKVPPGKVAEKVVKTFPNAAGKVVDAVNRAGGEIYYRTPVGDVLVDRETAQSGYSNYPTFLKTQDIFGSIPVWVYALGAGGILLAFTLRK